MVIELIPEKDFPFGQNIHFVYDIENELLRFIHPSFTWITDRIAEKFPENIRHILPPDEYTGLLQVCREWTSGSVKGAMQLSVQPGDGTRWIRLTPFLAHQEGIPLVFAILEELTDQVQNNETTVKYANKKNSILNMLSHDLRGPLSVARAVLRTFDFEDEPELLKRAAYIATILEQSIGLIDDLTAREFLETADVVLFKKRVDLVEKIGQYIEECKRSSGLAERSFELISTLPSLPAIVDEAKFMQVINNLLSNALKFTRPGGHITIGLQEQADNVVLSFSDDGIGIPKELMPRLFDKYSTAGRTGLNGEPTLGLGLSIVKTIIEWHNGSVSCESEEGKGTTFRIVLPLNA